MSTPPPTKDYCENCGLGLIGQERYPVVLTPRNPTTGEVSSAPPIHLYRCTRCLVLYVLNRFYAVEGR